MRYLLEGRFDGWTGGKYQVFHSQRGRYWARPKVANNSPAHIYRTFKDFSSFLHTPTSGPSENRKQTDSLHSHTSWIHMYLCLNKRIYENVCCSTSWWVDLLPFQLAQAFHQGVGFCQGWQEGYHGIVVGRSLEQCQMRSGWPTGRRFASPYLLRPAGNAEHCVPLSVGRTACDEDAVEPANHAQLLKLNMMKM